MRSQMKSNRGTPAQSLPRRVRGPRMSLCLLVLAAAATFGRWTFAGPVLSVSLPNGPPVDFGSQACNDATPLTLDIQLSNVGDAAFADSEITAALATGSDFLLGVASIPEIAPGGNTLLPVTFVPSSAGTKNDQLTISIDNVPDTTIAVTGKGIAPTQTFSADPLDFGTTPVGMAVVAKMTIGNSGNATLNLAGAPHAMEITGADAADFEFTDHGCDGQQTCDPVPSAVDPGGSMDFMVGCTPSDVGARSAILNVRSDDPASPRTASLACTGSDVIFEDGFEAP